ncbi:putative polysaccharide biosynthesis protein [Isobaculum melis]|uniref:Membrane protein involved in the export of O-antigen and teichoic acid n=1 Tax=Isobaculum melis TaxID=142588 RepID=A0A1H9UHL9_9LACT|nr:polysaccharide biosynthesis protein [Isobaculum melis]SES08936.1 Membrane protein involved in the export of O-antigen and teichoic acid [Isobaculum melis]
MQDSRSNNINTTEAKTSKQKMISGSAWMTAGSMFSRILGAIYVIPWLIWLGKDSGANTLFGYGYVPYTIFLSIASAGIPSAIAKQVARYNAVGEYKTSNKLFRQGLLLMIGTGIICFLVMFFGAEMIAKWTVAGKTDTLFPITDVAKVIRSLSWALLVIPAMSLVRGYFQGYQNMVPSATSQMIEQIFRVIFMLGATFTIMKLWNGQVVDAVTASTFAAFIGALFSCGLLFYYWVKAKPSLERNLMESRNQMDFSTMEIFKEMIATAIPFILVGTAIPIYQQIDQFSFVKIMTDSVGIATKTAEVTFGIVNFNTNKLIMIIISLAIAIATTVLPLITESYTNGKIGAVRTQVSEAIQLFFFVMLPAAFGMAAIAGPMYTIFYGYSANGEWVLIAASISSILLGLFTLIASIAQGVEQQKFSILALGVGIVVKMITQYPLVFMFKEYGIILSTSFGFTVSCIMIAMSLKSKLNMQFKLMLKRILLIILMTAIMLIVTLLAKMIFGWFLNEASRGQAFILVMLCVAVAGGTYGYLALKIRLADKLLGDKVAGLRRKLKIK